MAKVAYKNGVTSVILRVVLYDSASTTGGRKTALTSASSGLIISTIADNEASATVYTAAGSTVETITTLGTFAAPTATKCRFKEVDATNHPGLYEIQIADARWAVSNARSIVISVQCTGAVAVDAEVQLTAADLNDATALGVSRIDAAISSRMATYTQPTGFLLATFPTGTVANTTNITGGTITNVTNLTNAPTAGDFTAAMKTSLNAATPAVTVSDKTGFSLSTAGIAAIWNALTSGMTTVGSVGKKLADWVLGSDSKALLSTDAQTGVTIPTVTTVTGGATAATQTSILNAVNAITTNTARTGITVPQFHSLPASGTSVVRVKIKLFDLQGALEDADTNTVTVHAADASGTSLDANLSATTATRDSAGQYHVDYTVHAADAEGGVYIAVTYAVGAVSMAADAVFAVAQADTVTSIAAIKAKTDNLPASPAATGDAMTLTAAYDAAKTAQQAGSAVTLPTIPANWLTAAGIAAGALNSKGDWLLASGYTAPDNADILLIKAKTDNLPASPAAVGSAMTLADGAISTAKIVDGAITDAKFTVPTEPTGLATGVLSRLDQMWRRFVGNKSTQTSTEIVMYKSDGTTPVVTQAVSDDGITQTQGAGA